MNDAKAYITAKKARIARAGKQVYTAEELLDHGITLKDGKKFGVVYRPPEMLVGSKDKFANVPFVNDHAPVDVTPDNWKEFTIGFVGSSVDVEVYKGELWLTGDVIFYDRKAYEDYKSGKVELSASYDAKYGVVVNPDEVGYDVVLLDIPVVNHVALCDAARAGHDARVLDSLNITGGNGMAVKVINGFLNFFGIGKAKDASFKFSKVLMDSIEKIKTLKPDEVEKEVIGVMGHVTSLGDSEERALLVGAVSDCYKHSTEVLAKKDEISVKIDELYGKCQDAGAAAAAKILDSSKKPDEKKPDETKPTNDQVNIPELIEAALTKAFTSFSDSIDKKIDASVKKVLGLDGGEKEKNEQRSVSDSAGSPEDASYLVRGIFGNR